MSAGTRRGLIFDLDGTLIDSYGAITESLNHARAYYGLAPLDRATVRAAVGHGLERLIATWVGERRIERGVELFRDRYAEVFAEGTQPLPGAAGTLQALDSAGYLLALASNKPARFSRPILERMGWDSMFAAVEGPDTVGATKPDPRMLRACLAALDCPAERALYVGDMPLDAVSGARAGIAVVLVRGGSASDEELKAVGPPVLDRIADLPRHLTALGWAAARRVRPTDA